jgi:hypothetical protein
MSKRIGLFLLAAAGLGGGAPPAPAPARESDASPPASATQMSEARLILERHCGLCHREDSPRARRGALAVFNLNKPDWSASMSDDRLRDARGRLRDMQPRGRSDDAVLDESFGSTTTPAEVATFDAFVDAELARRGH